MATILERAHHWWTASRCCPPPPQITGVTVQPGGGSGELVVSWQPLPANAHVALYRVYEKKDTGRYWHLAIVTDDALGLVSPGRLGIVDAADFWPWPSGGLTPGPRCYVVTAVSHRGLEGPLSVEVCGTPPGG